MAWLSIKEFFIDSFKLLLVIAIILILMIYVVSVTQVVGDSMSPTLQDQEVLITNKLQYRLFAIERGDVVSLEYEDTKYLIKRVIGLPGETVAIRNNHVYINGQMLEEAYLEENLVYPDFELSSLGYDQIPENMYFVLGDNRANSMDSREIGLVKKEDITGKIALRFWPINKFRFF